MASAGSSAAPRRPLVRRCVVGAALVAAAIVLALNALQIRALGFAKGVDQTYLFESLLRTTRGEFFVHSHAITNLGGWGAMDHFWPIMLLFVPLVAVLQDPLALYVINAAAVAGTGLVVFALARHVFEDDGLACLGVVVFWTMPETYYVAISGNWPEVWALPLLAVLLLAYRNRRPWLFAGAAVLFMACMEHLLVFVLLFAVLELLTRRERRWLAIPVALALAWLGVLAAFADSFGAGRFFTHEFSVAPGQWLGALEALFLELDRTPLLYLSLLSPLLLVLALPPLAVILGWGFELTLIPSHDGLLRYGFFVFLIAAVAGLGGVRKLAVIVSRRTAWSVRGVASVLLLTVTALHVAALVRMVPRELGRFVPDAGDDLVWQTIAKLPPDARVAADREIPYAFVGRAELFVCFHRSGAPEVKELYFDARNVPRGGWTAEHRFSAMGRRTPALFVLGLPGDGRPPEVLQAVWGDQEYALRSIRCRDVTGDERPEVLLFDGSAGPLVYEAAPDGRLTRGRRADGSSVGLGARADERHRVDRPGRRVEIGSEAGLELTSDRGTLVLHSPPGVREHRLGGYIQEAVIADLDGDGDDDAVAIDSQRYLLWLLEQRSEGGFERRGPYPAPPIPFSADVADLDGDGRAEILVAKSQRFPDLDALQRFLEHERIGHVFWYSDEPEGIVDHFTTSRAWITKTAGDVLYARRRSVSPSP